jgi:hypothetical protein
MIYSKEKGTSYQGQKECQMGSAMLQERGPNKKSAKSMLKSADGDSGESKVAEEHRKGGGPECRTK